MIAKGTIKSIDYEKYTCEVNIPIFQNAGDPKEVILTASLTSPPGIVGGYELDDRVFVEFENNEMKSPVVLGLLCRKDKKEKDRENKISIVCNDVIIGEDTLSSLISRITKLEQELSLFKTTTLTRFSQFAPPNNTTSTEE